MTKSIVEAHPRVAEEFLLDKKRKQLFTNLLRFEFMIKIDFNDVTTTNSVVQPLKGLIESLVATSPVVELLIEAEIKAVFAFRVNQRHLQRKNKKDSKTRGRLNRRQEKGLSFGGFLCLL